MARRLLSSAALLTAALTCSSAARAQVVDRLALGVEGVVGALLSGDHRDAYGVGLGFGVRPAVRLAGPLWLHAQASYGRWAEGGAMAGPATLWAFGAGLTVAPMLSPRAGRLLAQIEAGYGLTGQAAEGRAVLGAGVGWLIPLGRSVIDVGPVARFGYLLPDTSQSSNAGAATFVWAGLTVALRAPLERVAPLDRDGDGVLDADDRCPRMAAGASPDPSNAGCPAMDRDDDGVVDPEDACAEVPAGARLDPARRGCPREEPGAGAPPVVPSVVPSVVQSVVPPTARPVVPSVVPPVASPAARPVVPSVVPPAASSQPDVSVRFDGDTVVFRTAVRFAGEAIAPASLPLLDQAATLIQQTEGIRRVRVRCNVEEPGDRPARHVARARASAVADHLEARGIARDMLSHDSEDHAPPGALVITVQRHRASHSSSHHDTDASDEASDASRHHRRRHRAR